MWLNSDDVKSFHAMCLYAIGHAFVLHTKHVNKGVKCCSPRLSLVPNDSDSDWIFNKNPIRLSAKPARQIGIGFSVHFTFQKSLYILQRLFKSRPNRCRSSHELLGSDLRSAPSKWHHCAAELHPTHIPIAPLWLAAGHWFRASSA